MTARRAARFVLAPIVDGAADWTAATDLVFAPIRLSRPVLVAFPDRRPPGRAR